MEKTRKEPILEKQEDNETEFKVGDIVLIKSDLTKKGAVVGVQTGNQVSRVDVFLDGTTQIFYASQLKLENKFEEEFSLLTYDQFHAHLTALYIKYPGLNSLYSLNSARIDFIPYQFRPVLRFIRSDRPRLLIADSVGVGKTIEAGLILRELQARRDIRSVLIICPRPLVTEKKWQTEMKRFDERFTHLDGPTLRYCIGEMDLDGVWPVQHQKTIIPYSLFDQTLLHGLASEKRRKQQIGLLNLDPPPRFDLVIVDEAHNVRNQNTFSYDAVRFFCDHAEAVVFLTATPIQLGSKDLYTLLNLLRPDLIIDPKSFEHMAKPNPFINQAVTAMRSQDPSWPTLALESLNMAATTPWGRSIIKNNPVFSRVREVLSGGDTSDTTRVRLISDTEGLNTFDSTINRTRRRDIGNFTIRKPKTLEVPFTYEQQKLHDELLRIQEEIFKNLYQGNNVKFMMTTIRRQASSCLFGLVPFLEEILSRHIDRLSWEEADDSNLPEEVDISLIETQIENILKKTNSLGNEDPKLDALRTFIRDKHNLANNKIMLFSSFRHTLEYLFNKLRKDGVRVGLIHGGTPDEERVLLRARFELTKEDGDCLDVLLFSEVGCEGLDYQFCDCIVNYDLPWNPMRVEQRIGRIDRHGQKSESVAIVNLITPGTVDAEIYNRCLLRIGVFENALGGSEDILGEITREIKNIAENYDLSNEERNIKFQQLADNKIRLVQEQEELEEKQAELFGLHVPREQISQEINSATNFWLSPNSIRSMVKLYLIKVGGKSQEHIIGEKSLKTLRLDQNSRSELLTDFQQLNRQNSIVYREWETWLKGGSPHLPITFETDCAVRHPQVTFIMPLHPLVKQAANSLAIKQKAFVKLFIVSKDLDPGNYEFVIYQWRYLGIKENLVLKPISSNAKLTEQLDSLLEKAIDSSSEVPDIVDSNIWEKLDTYHYNLWNSAREEHKKEIQEISKFRRESLSVSHDARIALLKEQFEQASDKKIKVMRQSQIDSAMLDYSRRLQELDIASERADIIQSPVAFGLIQIENG